MEEAFIYILLIIIVSLIGLFILTISLKNQHIKRLNKHLEESRKNELELAKRVGSLIHRQR